MSAAPTHFDVGAIRLANPISRFLQKRGIELRGGGASGWRCSCPVHNGDNREAFHVLADDQHWHCFTGDCGSGDIFDLVMAMDGITFKDACAHLGGKEQTTTTSTPRTAPKPKPPPPPLPELDSNKRAEMQAMAARLRGDGELIASIAASRGWEPATISALASTGALGWIDEMPEGFARADGVVCFIYPHAVKVRGLWRKDGSWQWSRPDGDRLIRWAWRDWPWNKVELWREDMLRRPMRGRAIVVEGETDAITLIDRGANDDETDVVALPDSGITQCLLDRLPGLFADLHVTMAPDLDKAGQKAEAKFTAAVYTVAKSYRIVRD